MGAVERLMGLGQSPGLAARVGWFIQTVATAATVNGPGNIVVRASGESLNFGSNFDLGDVVQVMMVTTGTVYPASSERFGLKTTASGLVCTAGVTKYFTKMSNQDWLVTGTTA